MTSEQKSFRAFCAGSGLTATHQRQVLYEVIQGMDGHPSPEEIYVRVRRRIPSVSVATVYKNLHLFVTSGMLREVSPHHGTLRVEMNRDPHHHLVCTRCKSITDLDAEAFHLSLEHQKLPPKFQVERFTLEILGLCPACQKK